MTSHKHCSHPSTPSARAKCRKANSSSAKAVLTWEKNAHAQGVANEADVALAKAVARTAALGITVPHTNAVKPVGTSDVDWHLLLRNRARVIQSPWPTDEERAASLAKIWCTVCHLLHDLPACQGNAAPRTSPDDADRMRRAAESRDVAGRKDDSARAAAEMLPTFGNARKLAQDIPEGRYAVKGRDGVIKFYKIDKPTEGRWAGYVFLKVQASDDFHPIKFAATQIAVFGAILEAGVRESSALYGHTIGSCGVCGRTLTDADSIARGIGPVCASKNGW